MKSTLLLTCSLLCLLFFSLLIVAAGISDITPPEDAYSQVVNPEAASAYLQDQEAFNRVIGYILAVFSSLGVLTALTSLIFLRKERILVWFRVALLLTNVCLMLTCAVLFFVTLMETTQPTPEFLRLCRPWLDSYWARAIQQTQQSALFLGLCCGMLSGVNCMAFYFFQRRVNYYNS
ncbi:MAG: hypothetical protein J6R92_06185 [Akkermansia sp.]|nr:hypothetical protein [Akkermansia sp.]